MPTEAIGGKKEFFKKSIILCFAAVLFAAFQVLCAAAVPPRFDVAVGTGRLGGDVTLRAEAENASGAVWLAAGSGGLVKAAGDQVSSLVGGRLVSALTVKNVTQSDVEREYRCVFFTPEGCLVSGPARIVCLPEVEEDRSDVGDALIYGAASDHLGVQRLSCAWLTAAEEGTPEGGYLDGTGWYRVSPEGDYEPIGEGEREIPRGRTLALPGVGRSDDKATYAYRVVNAAGSAEQTFVVALEKTDSAISSYIKCVSLVMTESGSVLSGEPDKYTVTSFSAADGEYEITLSAEGDYKFRHDDRGLFYGRLGLTPVKSGKESPLTVTTTLRGKMPASSPHTVSVTAEELTLTDGAADTGLSAAAVVYGLPSDVSLANGRITASRGGFSFAASDGFDLKCFSVLSPEPAGTPPEFITTRLDGGTVGEGYAFALAFTPESTVASEVGSVLGSIGLTVSPDGSITGVPTRAGSFEITFSLVCGGLETRKTFVLAISEKQEYYTVSFVKNGGRGDMPDITVSAAVGRYVVPECAFEPPSGVKVFSHWSSVLGDLAPGEEIKLTSDLTLRATWRDADHVHSFRASASGGVHVMTCSCGETYTEPHRGGQADCRHKAKCEVCGAAYGDTAPHSYVNGVCSVCGAKQPSGGTSKTPDTAKTPATTEISEGTAARDSLGETSVPVTDAGTEESASPATPGTDTDSSGDTSQGTGTAEQTGLVRVDTRRPSDKGIIILLLVLVVICLAAGLIALAAAKRKR